MKADEYITKLRSVMNSIFAEMRHDARFVKNSVVHTKEFSEGYDEAVRNLAIIIKEETEISVKR